MVTIRLQRRGRKKRPIHHIVVADSRSPRDGRIVEDLGRFNNLPAKNELKLDEERAIYWLKQGAQPSDTVRSIFKKQGILYRMHLIRWGKSEEEIEEALDEWRANREAKEEDTPSKKERQQAMLEAEEKEYQRQLKKKAEQAAKEKAKQEALEAEAEEEAEDEVEAEAAEDAEEAVEAKDETEEEVSAADTDQDEDTDAEEEVEAKEDESDEDEADETEEAEAKAEEESEEDDDKEDTADKVSSDMLAKEAIAHIEETPVDELEGFVTDDESRVTVQRAWEEKQGE